MISFFKKIFLTCLLFAQLAYADCRIDLHGNPILAAAAPVLISFNDLTNAYADRKIVDLVTAVERDREAFIVRMKDLAEKQPAFLRDLILKKIDRFGIVDFIRQRLDNAVSQFGEALMPEAGELSPEIYEIWKPRFNLLSGISLTKEQFGTLGEWIAISNLPSVTATNVRAAGLLFTGAERKRIEDARKNLPDTGLELLARRLNLEFDVVFDGGRSLGEIKFANRAPIEGTEPFAKFKNQAERMHKLIAALDALKIHFEGHFIFVGAGPSEAQSLMLKNYGLHVIHMPLPDSDAARAVSLSAGAVRASANYPR